MFWLTYIAIFRESSQRTCLVKKYITFLKIKRCLFVTHTHTHIFIYTHTHTYIHMYTYFQV